eukprot:143562_1
MSNRSITIRQAATIGQGIKSKIFYGIGQGEKQVLMIMQFVSENTMEMNNKEKNIEAKSHQITPQIEVDTQEKSFLFLHGEQRPGSVDNEDGAN